MNPSDLVAVRLPPGPAWADLVADVWAGGAALLPVDSRLPEEEALALVSAARPTLVLDPGGPARLPDGLPADPGVALVIATSGSAGRPKLAQFERSAIDAAVTASALALEAGPHDPWLCCLPLAHVGGLLVLLRSVLLGAPVFVHPRFDPAAIGRERGAAFVSLVPTMLARLLDAGVDLGRFRAILVGGAALPRELAGRAAVAGARVIETYGLTESCGGVVYEGRPLPGIEVRIEPERSGIELRGPTLMHGYRFDTDATAAAFTPDGWLRPGDAGAIDDRGRLHVIGRLDDLILSGGEKVWPEEVEAALRDHPLVADVAIAGRPDPEWGERVAAFVIPKDPNRPPSLGDLRDFAARTLARHKAPRELVLVSDLPRTASGKVRRHALA